MSYKRVSDEAPRKTERKLKKKLRLSVNVKEVFKLYKENVKNIEKKFELYNQLVMRGETKEADEILRSQIVFLDSAFDYFVHGIVVYGLKMILNGDWERTGNFNQLQMSFEFVTKIIRAPEINKLLIDEWLIPKVYRVPLMDYESAKEYLGLIGITYKKCAFYNYDSEITNLYRRRNAIAHQADRDRSTGALQSISKNDVENFIRETNNVVECIKQLIIEKNKK